MMKNYFLLFALLLSTGLVHSQVTIGSGEKPSSGALLDLKEKNNPVGEEGKENANKGLGLPRVELTDLNKLKMGDNDIADAPITGGTVWEAHTGLVVYNVKERTTETGACPGLHVWDGVAWHPIVPYPAINTTRTILSKNITSETSRTPIIDPVKYPMGDLGTFADTRGSGATGETNTYGHARFYADNVVANGDITYRGIKNPYVCDARAVIEEWTETGQFTYIDDGIWMTNNVYATQKVDGAAFTDATALLNPAYFDDGTGAIAIGVKGLTGASITYGENPAESIATTTLSQLDYAKKFGLSYTWTQASESCPDGWRLPNDYEWNALAVAHGGAATAGAKMRANNNYYNSRDKSAASDGFKWGVDDAAGTTLSGFAALPSGYVGTDGADANGFSSFAGWWSATTSGSYRYMIYSVSDLRATTIGAGYYFSVRCVKN